MKRLLLPIVLIFFIAATVLAQKFPSPTGHVNDFVGVMSVETKGQLEGLLRDFKTKTGIEIAVAVVQDMGGSDIESYAVDLFKEWGVGSKDLDNGLLFVIAVKERRLRIEVGYGLEGTITDGTAGEIRDRFMTPYLSEGDWDRGISQGVLAAMDRIAKANGVELNELVAQAESPQPVSTGNRGSGSPFGVIIIIVIFLLMMRSRTGRGILIGMLLSNMMGGGRNNRHYGGGFGGGFGGGGGGGFGGFGGGFSGGGGASGRF